MVALGESLALALGLVQPGDIGLLLVGVELAAAVIALTALPSVLRVVRAERSRGQTFSAALLAAAEELLPPGLVSVARFELGLWRSAYRWITPVPRAERGAVRLSYGASERLMLWVLLPCGLVELTVMDYLLRNTPLRWPLFVLGVLTVPYLLGAIARTKAQPHLLFDDRLLLRSGPDFAVEVPLAWIERASRRPQLNQGRGALRSDDGALRLAYGQQTDVRIQLDRPLLTALGPVTCIDVAVDDPHHPAVQELLTRR